MKKSKKSLLNRHFALIIALMFAAMVATLVFVLPQWRFDRLLNLIGVGRFFPGVSAPYGMNARLAIVAVAAVVTFVSTWPLFRFVESFLGGKRARRPGRKSPIGGKPRDAAKTANVRAADAHPDAPPRRPIFAEAELGAPLMSQDAISSDGELILGERDQALPIEPVAVQSPPGFGVASEYAEPAPEPEAAQPMPPLASMPLNGPPVEHGSLQSQPDEAEAQPQVRGSLFAAMPSPALESRPSFATVASPARESIFSTVADPGPAPNLQATEEPVPPQPEAPCLVAPQGEPLAIAVSDRPDDDTGEPPIAVLVNRLDAALKRRAVSISADPSSAAACDGDISSLREALRSFGGVA